MLNKRRKRAHRDSTPDLLPKVPCRAAAPRSLWAALLLGRRWRRAGRTTLGRPISKKILSKAILESWVGLYLCLCCFENTHWT